jgi:hypothetical protein
MTTYVSQRVRGHRYHIVVGVSLLLVLAGGVVWMVASAHRPPGDAAPGVVTGQVPPCYGPGPDSNLTPIVVVTAARHGTVAATVKVVDTNEQHTYRLVLPPGQYQIRASAWPERSVRVRSGRTTRADLPGGGCL